MIETREFRIVGKRFKRADLLSLGKLFLSEFEAGQQAGHGPLVCAVEFNLSCSDGTRYFGEDLSHLQEGAEIDLKPPSQVSFSFRDVKKNRRMELTITQGGNRYDSFSVRGADRDWVQGIFTSVQERISAAEPSEGWFSAHPILSFLLLALGLGSLVNVVVSPILREGIAYGLVTVDNPPPAWTKLLSNPIDKFLIGWSLTLFLGLFPAIPVSSWVFKAWPDVELDIGPEHMKAAKKRRDRFAAFWLLVLLPLVVAFVYDFIK